MQHRDTWIHNIASKYILSGIVWIPQSSGKAIYSGFHCSNKAVTTGLSSQSTSLISSLKLSVNSESKFGVYACRVVYTEERKVNPNVPELLLSVAYCSICAPACSIKQKL